MNADQKIQAFETLLNEMSGAIADAVDLMKAGHVVSDEMRQTLADISEAIKSPATQDPGAMVAALKSIRIDAPGVTVQNQIDVKPTPVEINNQITCTPTVQMMPGDARSYQVTHTYDTRGRIEQSLITPVKNR